MSNEFTLAIIGLDTSHTIEFTKLIQGEGHEGKKIEGLKVLKAMRFPSPFQTEEGQDERQKKLEGWGVSVGTSFEEAVEGVDGILMEINDPAPHLEYFEKAAALGKPIFLDKPLAATLEDGRKICEIAKNNSTRVWSSSSLRYLTQIDSALENIPAPSICNVYGALGKAAAGSDLVWYGVHTNEMLVRIMGLGAKSVFATEDECGIVEVVDYGEGRRGVVECNRGIYKYGGRIQDQNNCIAFDSGDDVLYYNLLLEVKEFLLNGKIPVPLNETLEVQAIIDAAERSLKSGKAEKVLL